MPDPNGKVVRDVYERWGQGDFRESLSLFDPQLVYILGADFPDAGVYVGLDRLAEYMREFLEPWARLTIEAERIVGAGDSFVVDVVQRGTGDGSGAATQFRYVQVWSFRGGKVIRLENFRERADALAAAGLAATE